MKVLLFFLLLAPACSTAQKKDTVLKYLDKNLEFTSKTNAAFFGVAVKRENSWFLYALYPDTSALLKAYYKDRALRIKEGPYSVYYPKKGPAQQGHYQNNKMVGNWRFWYENGQLKDSGLMETDRMVGQWKSWYPNGQLKTDVTFKKALSEEEKMVLAIATYTNLQSSRGLLHGPFSSWYENGKLESTGFFTDNQMDGEWQWYHENGKQSTFEVYKSGKLVLLNCFDTTGQQTGDVCPIAKRAVLKYYGDYKTYIQQNLTWPADALKYKIEGNVTVRFKVNKQGKIENFTIQSDFPVLAKAVEELFGSMTDWYPAVSHNRVIEWEEEYTIPFFRQN